MPRFAEKESCALAIGIQKTEPETPSVTVSASWSQLTRATELLIRTCVLGHGYGGTEYWHGLQFVVAHSAKVPRPARVAGAEASGVKAPIEKGRFRERPGRAISAVSTAIKGRDQSTGAE